MEFDVESEDLSDLQIRVAEASINYFYDTKRTHGRSLVKHFILMDKPRTAVMVTVTLVKKPDGCSPRFKFWLKDKTKLGQTALELNDHDAPLTVKGAVDATDAHKNLWKLITFVQGVRGIVIPEGGFSVVPDDAVKLIELLQSEDKAQVLEAIRTALGSNLTDKDISLIANRKQELAEFERLLNDAAYFAAHRERTREKPEGVWQNFFERNRWIFGYGLNLIATDGMDDGKLERATAGKSVFLGAGNRIDALMRTRGYVNTLLFCEIKRHDAELLAKNPYRKPSTFAPSYELVGGVAQVQKTTRKALRHIGTQMHSIIGADGAPTGLSVSGSRPRQVVVIGKLQEFDTESGPNGEMMESFELFRTALADTEVITYDELYERARFIVED
ncbi:Shedu immune nuclease family protein [Pseudonocardia hydrocarbonoxydans]|uniref:Shedu immune nuclease family protein n=1 Tax=Pseudonocardia hydrocarbonoxydans TaxID=76726 RepID=UPI001FE8B663|nr:Shedu immune nuclease family protein [Pseudonocardia hydrocarbonoxydans]